MEEWIRVEDRLPEDNVKVLCLGLKGGLFVGYCVHAARAFHREEGLMELEWYAKGHYCPKVIAWVPIPPIPEELMWKPWSMGRVV